MRVLSTAVATLLLATAASAGRDQQQTKGFVNPKAVVHFNRQLSNAFELIKQPLVGTEDAASTSASDGDGLRHLSGMTEGEICESTLMDCMQDLNACSAASASQDLFVQMASNCVLSKIDGAYELSTDSMDTETYAFTDRPMQIESTIHTQVFIENFDETFSEENGGKPNAAFTFVHSDSDAFEGPLVAVQIEAKISEDGSVTYMLEQSESQAAVVPLDSFFASGDEVTFDDCSIFIDSAATIDPSTACSADGGYVWCRAQHCVRPWDPSVNSECCNQLDGYSYLLGCTPTASTGCCEPNPPAGPPSSAPTPQCVADGGYMYCAAQGCVQPWDPSTENECCGQLEGFNYLLGCTPTASQGCCEGDNSGSTSGSGGGRRNLKGGALV